MKLCAIAFSVFLSFFVVTAELHSSEEDSCRLLMSQVSNTAVDANLAALFEARPFTDFLKADPQKNLAALYPFSILNAPQRILAVIQSQGHREMSIAGINSPVTVYPIFSDGLKISGGEFIIGHEKEIAELVDSLKANNGGSPKVPTLVGPHGTGKSLFLKILRKAIGELTRNDPRFYYYSFEWMNLREIPELKFLNKDSLFSPLHDSPYVLLPEALQDEVLSFATINMKSLGISKPNPVRTPNPQDQFIRNTILLHYLKEDGHELSNSDVVRILDKHVRLRRVVLGQDGTAPIVDAEGRDYNQGDLFISRNPLYYPILGQNHPMSYFYGVVPSANGSILFLDEFARNDPKLRDMFLRLFEERGIKVGASPLTPIDAFIIAATNSANLGDMMSEAKGHAHRDRLHLINFLWSIRPQEISKTLLMMTRNRALVSDLKKPGMELVQINYPEVFPIQQQGKVALTTDYRYRLSIDLDGLTNVPVSPHTLAFISYVISASRLNFNAEEATKQGAFSVINTPVYRDIPSRLRYLTGDSTTHSAAVDRELEQSSVLTREGDYGITARDAFKWFEVALSDALKDSSEGVLTPRVAMQTLRRLLDEGSIEYLGDLQLREKWKKLADIVMERLILPKIERDVLNAITEEKDLVQRTYKEMLLELNTIINDPSATQYRNPSTKRVQTINQTRLHDIQKIYQEINRRPLDINQIASMHMVADISKGVDAVTLDEDPYDSELLNAIREYYARKAGDNIDLRRAVMAGRQGEGDTDSLALYDKLSTALLDMGYTRESALQAMELVEQYRAREKQLESEKQQ